MARDNTLTVEERVAVWVSRDTRKKLLQKKIKDNYNNLDSLIIKLLKNDY